MGLSPLMQDAALNWFKGTPYPDPPTELWLALHTGFPATSGNQSGFRYLISSEALGTPRNASREPLPQVPFVPGNGDLRDLPNILRIRTELISEDAYLLAFSFWDSETEGNMLLRGRLQEPIDAIAGEVVSFGPGDLLLRATSP